MVCETWLDKRWSYIVKKVTTKKESSHFVCDPEERKKKKKPSVGIAFFYFRCGEGRYGSRTGKTVSLKTVTLYIFYNTCSSLKLFLSYKTGSGQS